MYQWCAPVAILCGTDRYDTHPGYSPSVASARDPQLRGAAYIDAYRWYHRRYHWYGSADISDS